MFAQALMVASAAILLLLGSAHLLYTFSGSKLRPRDPQLQESMARCHPGITRGTTMWRAWVGFNASHSLGAMLFGLLYSYFALAHPQLLFNSVFLLAVGLGMLVSLMILAIRYWFSVPRNGIAVALTCYLLSLLVWHL